MTISSAARCAASRSLRSLRRTGLCVALLAATGLTLSGFAAAAPAAHLKLSIVASPSHLSSEQNARCTPALAQDAACDAYTVLATNTSAAASSGALVLADTLTNGVHLISGESPSDLAVELRVSGSDEACSQGAEPDHISCAHEGQSNAECSWSEAGETTPVRCEYLGTLPGYATLSIVMHFTVAESLHGSLSDTALASGGAGEASASVTTPIGPEAGIPFAVEHFSFGVYEAEGLPDLQAAAHPAAVIAGFTASSTSNDGTLAFGKPGLPVQAPKDVVVDLPVGLVGDPQVAPSCPAYMLPKENDGASSCPANTIVGSALVDQQGKFTGSPVSGNGEEVASALYNITPDNGYPAEFGFTVFDKPVFLHASLVATPSGYDLQVIVPGIPGATGALGAYLTFYGNPGEHDAEGGTPATATGAFFTNPSDCSASAESLKAHVYADSYLKPGEWITDGQISNGPLGPRSIPLLSSGGWVQGSAENHEDEPYPGGITGCDALSFTAPSLEIQPESSPAPADTPEGYNVDLKVPQSGVFSDQLATPDLKDTTVTLPAGVSVSPSSAEGLAGCPAQGPEGINLPAQGPEAAGAFQAPAAEEIPSVDEPGHCPEASKLGTIEIDTPLLANPLQGNIYLGQPQCRASACTEADAAEGRLLRIYLEAQGEGVVVKLAGTVSANPQTGQLTARFLESPQLPFSELKLHFHGGPRAPLSDPQTCGAYTTSSLLEPWSAPETPSETSLSSFTVAGCDGFPFSPTLAAGTLSSEGGSSSPFTLTFARKDGEQDLSTISLQMPPGLLGKIAGIPQCGEAQANAGTCGAESQIGTTTVAAGAGTHPLYLTGKVYLTGPYDGDPFGLSIVVPAVAGPFNLGDVVVRASIAINPTTAALTVTSTAIPQVVDGVPTRLQSVNVDIDKAGFILNATNCDQQAIGASVGSANGATAVLSTPYAASGCKNLPFSPKLTASTSPYTSPKRGSALDVEIAYQSGQANIKRVDVTLPKKVSARLEPTLKNACSEAQFASNPAGCPEDSFAGTAKAVTPLLNVPLKGPAIFVSHGGAKFPDLDLVLQGEGVTVILTGHTEIKGDTTYSRFETVPDAPINSFVLSLPEGPHSALSPNLPKRTDRSFCGRTLLMPTMIEGQNGAVVKQTTKVEVQGCKPRLRILSRKINGEAVKLVVAVPAAGKLAASGKELTKATKKPGKAKDVTVSLKLTKNGKKLLRHASKKQRRLAVKLVFIAKHGNKLTKQLKVMFTRKGGSR